MILLPEAAPPSWVVGYTFELSVSLPGPANKGGGSPRGSKRRGQGKPSTKRQPKPGNRNNPLYLTLSKRRRRGKSRSSTTAGETSPQNERSSTGAMPKSNGSRPRNSANAGTAPNRPSPAKRAAPGAPQLTGSPAGAATTREGPRPKGIRQEYQEALLVRQASRMRTGYNPRHDDHQQPRRLPGGAQEQPSVEGCRPVPESWETNCCNSR